MPCGSVHSAHLCMCVRTGLAKRIAARVALFLYVSGGVAVGVRREGKMGQKSAHARAHEMCVRQRTSKRPREMNSPRNVNECRSVAV